MARDIPPGYYLDKHGNLQKDRRKNGDRRRRGEHVRAGDERRQHMRRKTDRQLIEREHRQMVDEALEDFAAEHQS